MTNPGHPSEWDESAEPDAADELMAIREQFAGFAESFDAFAGQFAGFAEGITGFPERFGERLCLDFVNTLERPSSTAPTEHLADAPDLAGWAAYAGVIEGEQVVRVLGAIRQRPDEARSVFGRALALREALRQIFYAIAQGEAPDEDSLSLLQTEYLRALESSQLLPGEEHYRWRARSADLETIVGAVATSAIEVLTEDDLSRIKACPGAEDCGHLFYDTTRNGRRRWCSMLTCGSRVKMRHLYARQRGQKGHPAGAPPLPPPAQRPRPPKPPSRSRRLP